jgi:hypothetical protein
MAAMQIRRGTIFLLAGVDPDRARGARAKFDSQNSGALISVKKAFDRR